MMSTQSEESDTPARVGIADRPDDSSSRLCLHQFSETILKTTIHFAVLKLKDSFVLWIGTKKSFPNLAVALTLGNEKVPLGTRIFGDIADPTAQNLALRLATKTKRQVFVSCEVQSSESMLLSLIEKRLNEEIERHPELF